MLSYICIGLQVKYRLFLSDYLNKLEFYRQILENFFDVWKKHYVSIFFLRLRIRGRHLGIWRVLRNFEVVSLLKYVRIVQDVYILFLLFMLHRLEPGDIKSCALEKEEVHSFIM